MINKIQITHTGNLRYCQLQVGTEYYLLDLDGYKLFWFLPSLVGLFPMKAQKLEGPIKIKTKKPPRFPITVGVATPLVTALVFRFFPLTSLPLEHHQILLLVIALHASIIGIKMIISHFLKIEEGKKVQVKIRYQHLTKFYKQVLPALFIFVIITIWLIGTFIQTRLYLALVAMLIFSSLMLYFHNLMHMPFEPIAVEVFD